MSIRAAASRRAFIETLGAGGLMLAARPVFAIGAAANDQVRLNYNESPYGPSEKALKAIRDSISDFDGRYYEDTYYDNLSNVLAKHHGVARENIHVGAGSTEFLKICDDIFLRDRAKLVVAEPAYEAVIQYAVNSKADATKVALTPDYRHDLPKMAAAVNRDTGLVYICNPNNPTGTIVRKDEMQAFMERVPESVPVVVDEAYSHFANDPGFESAIKYVKEGRNVIVAKTFSKVYGMAGMRVGYVIARKDLIERIHPFTVDYTVTGMAANAAIAAINDQQHVDRVVKQNATQRQNLFDEMKRLKFEHTASQANFVMINVKKPVVPVIQEFEKRKVLVGREFPALPTFMRVTLGTADEMKKFFVAFQEIFRA